MTNKFKIGDFVKFRSEGKWNHGEWVIGQIEGRDDKYRIKVKVWTDREGPSIAWLKPERLQAASEAESLIYMMER